MTRWPMLLASALLLTLAACGNGGPSESERIEAYKAQVMAGPNHPSEAEFEKAVDNEFEFPSCTATESGDAYVCPLVDKNAPNDKFNLVLKKVAGKWTVTGFKN